MGPIVSYLGSLPHQPSPNCAAGTYYYLNNTKPAYNPNGTLKTTGDDASIATASVVAVDASIATARALSPASRPDLSSPRALTDRSRREAFSPRVT